MSSILDRYIGKVIISVILLMMFTLLSLSSVIKFVDQLKKSGQGQYNTMNAGIYTLLSIPKDIQIFFPVASLLGVLIGLGTLAQHSELVVMQASGFTRMQVAFAVLKIAIPLALLAIIVSEWIAPYSEQIARNYRAKAMYGCSLISKQRNLWIKDNNNFIYIDHVDKNYKLYGVYIYSLDKNHHLSSIRYAVSAKFDMNKKLWYLLQVNESNLQNQKQINNSRAISVIWQTNLTPDKLNTMILGPDMLPISVLYNYIKYLKSSGQDVRRYQLNMWRKIFQPICVAVMMLMAISFIYGPLRDITIGMRVVTGIGFGFLFYLLDQIFGLLTIVYNVPSIIGALFPSLSFLLLSLWLLNKYD